MENTLKKYLIESLESDNKVSINNMQFNLSLGFVKASFLSTLLKKNNIISTDGKVLLTKEEILALSLDELNNKE